MEKKEFKAVVQRTKDEPLIISNVSPTSKIFEILQKILYNREK